MKIATLTILILLVSLNTLYSLEVPSLTGRVNDRAGILTHTESSNLEEKLKLLEQKSGSQVAVLIIPSLNGENLEDWSMKVVEKWKLGDKKRDNGALLLISMIDRKIRIETGYGLESNLTDAKCGYIIRKIIAPDFKRKNYYAGINKGITTIGGVILKTSDIPDRVLRKRKKSVFALGSGTIIFIIFILTSIFRGGGRGRRGYRRGGSTILWGGTGYSSSSGGGFSGFSGGGGSFGGGGASGGW